MGILTSGLLSRRLSRVAVGAAVMPGPALAGSFLGSSYTIYPTFYFGFFCPLNLSGGSDRVAPREETVVLVKLSLLPWNCSLSGERKWVLLVV